MSDDRLTGIENFFEYISSYFERATRNKRIKRARSKKFKNANINIRATKYDVDYVKNSKTYRKKGSNKKVDKFDGSANFNSCYFIDDP
jgi:hypothetical protein